MDSDCINTSSATFVQQKTKQKKNRNVNVNELIIHLDIVKVLLIFCFLFWSDQSKRLCLAQWLGLKISVATPY